MNKPKPTVLKLIQGNPGGRPLNKNEPKPPAVTDGLKPPRYLSKNAKKAWRKNAKQMRDSGILTVIDLKAFARLCDVESRLIEALAGLDKHGMLVKSPNGYPQQSPYFTVVNRLHEQLMGLLSDFGMTPSSRSRINVDPSSKTPDDDFERYLDRGKG